LAWIIREAELTKFREEKMKQFAPAPLALGATEISATPTIAGELGKGNVGPALGLAYETVRRQFSGLLGPTASEKSEGAIPWGKNPDGSQAYQYRPLGDRMSREAGLFTSPFVSEETMLKPDPQDGVVAHFGKAFYNQAASLTGMLTSPGAAMLGAVGAGAPALGKAASGAFAVNFNLREAPNWGGAFDAQNRLTGAAHGGGVASFTYDGLGRCVRRTTGTGTTLYTYDEWNPMLEWDQGGNRTAWTIYGAGADEILARYDYTGPGPLLYKQDKSGNVVGLLDSAGNIIEKYTYDTFGAPKITDWWGNPHVNAGNEPQSWYGNRFMFQGREYLSELAIYDYRNRFYHPGLGRFLQSDPTGFGAGDANLFRYCGNDPVNGSDPFGLEKNYEAHTSSTEPINVIGFEIPENPFADSATRQSTDVFSNFMHDFDNRGDRDTGFSLNSAPPTLGVAALPPLPSASRRRTQVPVVSYSLSISPKLPRIGTLLGGSLTISRDMYKRYFFSIGPQVGKSPHIIGLAITNNYVYGVDQPSPAQISEMMNNWSWNASAGHGYIGGQVSGPFAWPLQISSYGGGAMTPQGGFGVNWTTQLTDDDE